MERRLYVLALTAILSAVAGASCGRARFAMRTLFSGPPEEVRPAFSHVDRLGGEESCLDCHAGIERDGGGRSNLGLIFAHSTHMNPSSGNCMRCHQAVTTAKAEVPPPSMETCADGCHQSDFTDLKCKTCHLDLSRYALEEIQSWSHSREFERRHGPSAKRERETCATCHETSFCSDCHADNTPIELAARRVDQPTRAFIHPAPYESIHALDAASGRDRCDTCHQTSFCDSCHTMRGVSGEGRRATHPDRWLDPTSPSFHGFAARRSIASCASCHDQGEQSVCVRCHQVGGTGGNPHPRDFSRRDEPENNRMCRTCHLPTR